MTDPRRYSSGTRAALAWLSRGKCYNPDCERPSPIIAFRGGEPYVDFQIAQSLNNLSIRLGEAGRRDEADQARSEAVDIERRVGRSRGS